MNSSDIWKEVSRLNNKITELGERIIKLETKLENLQQEKEKQSGRGTAIMIAIVSGVVSATTTIVILIVRFALSM